MKKLIRLRQEAFARQQSRCFYCRMRMWCVHPSEVPGLDEVSIKVARHLQRTAEHLKPMSEGGRDEPGNIVAACQRCNRNRHRAKQVLTPERYAQHVRRRVAAGRWHVASIMRKRNRGSGR